MKYGIHVVGNDELPDGVDRVIVERCHGLPLLLVTEKVAGNWRFLKAWQDEQNGREETLVTLRAV